MNARTLKERIDSRNGAISPAERRVARVFQENREELLYASAAALAAKASTSDATVIRTARTLGFDGLHDLRRLVASELKQSPSIDKRLSHTLETVGDDIHVAFEMMLNTHLESIERLRSEVSPPSFRAAVTLVAGAQRVAIFGIGPSRAMADYLAIQLKRIGKEALTLTQTGLLFADELRQLRAGDLIVVMAYSRVYRELAVLLEESNRLGLKKILLTDSLTVKLRNRVDLILPVARGRADLLSTHTATLALLETVLVAVAAQAPTDSVRSLQSLNRLRKKIVGEQVDL